MNENEDSKEARARAWRVALEASNNLRNTARQLLRDAELATMRRLICASLPGREVEYWGRVEEEMKR